MEEMEHKVRRTIEEYHMLSPGDRVIAAVSGGADSVCLLALLYGMKEEWDLQLRAVHVHHGLRDRRLTGMRILSGRCVQNLMSPVIS